MVLCDAIKGEAVFIFSYCGYTCQNIKLTFATAKLDIFIKLKVGQHGQDNLVDVRTSDLK